MRIISSCLAIPLFPAKMQVQRDSMMRLPDSGIILSSLMRSFQIGTALDLAARGGPPTLALYD